MSRRTRVTIDAETHAVRSRPDYPPRAVGYAIKARGKKEYWAFGHASGNNCTREQAVRRVKAALTEGKPTFHNAEFDLEVMEKDGIEYKGDYDDTMRMAFLNEPRSLDLGLKPQAAEHLNMPPDELNALKHWILEHVPMAKRKKSEWANYIALAPGGLTGVYAKGDVDREDKLATFYERNIREAGMTGAYAREMALIPIKVKMEKSGIRLRLKKLKRELPAMRCVQNRMASAIRRRLGVKDLNVGSSPQLAKALIENDLLSSVVMTKPSKKFPEGQVSTKRALLEQNCSDQKLVLMLGVWGTLETYINSFAENWIEAAERSGGYVHPSFNTVRQTDEWGGGGGFGARTGRFSSSEPNFQNIPSNVEGSPHEKELLALAKLLREEGVEFIGMRDYFEPDEGYVFLRRDYNQQELRILAHYDFDEKLEKVGKFLQMYLDNPKIDAHEAVQILVHDMLGVMYVRKHIKITNFGLIYGMGLAKLAARLGLDVEQARAIKQAILKAVTVITTINRDMKLRARKNEPFYTWGGRRYYCEEPIYYDTTDGGRAKRDLAYKMLNTEIQGSAADCTKEAMIRVDQNMDHRAARLVLQVHDELVVCAERSKAKREMQRMRESMESVKFRLPMLTDGEMGIVSWARLQATDSLKRGDSTKVWKSL